jgi:hypothetical protein
MFTARSRQRISHVFCIGLIGFTALLPFACSSGGGTPDTISGLITELRLDEREQPVFLKVRDEDGAIWEFAIEFDPDAEVSGAHLEQHRVQRLPVVVHVRESASGLYAAGIGDAPP